MKQGLAGEQALIGTLKALDKISEDYVVPMSTVRFSFDSEPIMAFGNDAFTMRPLAVRQLDSYLGIPAQYSDRMREECPDLWLSNVKRWVDTKYDDRRMVRVQLAGVRAFLSDQYKRIDNLPVASQAMSVLNGIPGVRLVSCDVTDSRLYIKAVSSDITGTVKGHRVGDLVEAGVMITNSEVGLGAVTVKPFAHFLVCTNGMVRDQSGMRAAHIGRRIDPSIEGFLSNESRMLEDMAVLSKLGDIVRAAFDKSKFAAWVNKMNRAAEQYIKGDLNQTIVKLGKAFDMTMIEQQNVMVNLVKEGCISRYALANAITRTAEDVESYDRATELETIGGMVIDMPDSQWAEIVQ